VTGLCIGTGKKPPSMANGVLVGLELRVLEEALLFRLRRHRMVTRRHARSTMSPAATPPIIAPTSNPCNLLSAMYGVVAADVELEGENEGGLVLLESETVMRLADDVIADNAVPDDVLPDAIDVIVVVETSIASVGDGVGDDVGDGVGDGVEGGGAAGGSSIV